MTNIEERSGAALREAEEIASDTAPIYDENGAIEPGFLRDVTAAIEADDKALVRALAGRLHEGCRCGWRDGYPQASQTG